MGMYNDSELDETKITDIWREYEKGVMYNRIMNLYQDTEDNYDFYYGNQWKNAKLGNVEKVCFNIINTIVNYKTSVLAQNTYSFVFTPNDAAADDETKELCRMLGNKADMVFENQNMDAKSRKVLKDSCINDEAIAHFYYTDDINAEVVDKNNIYYGNENEDDIEQQPYIIISFRKNVKDLKQEAKEKYKLSQEEIENILPDNEVEEQAGMEVKHEEITPMCLVLLKYYKKDGVVHYTKCTKFVTLEENKSTNMSLYPVAHLTWIPKKGYARGIGEVRRLIPNQIEINKTLMRRIISVQLSAYQKLVVNTEYIKDTKSLNKVGSIIKVKGATIDDVRKQVGYLNPTSMSPDSKAVQEELINYTQNLNGATDEARGNVDPTKASGKAILAVQQATQQPLNEQQYLYKQFLEDIARIWVDMWKAYEVNGITLFKEEQEQVIEQDMPVMRQIKRPVTISSVALQNLNASIKVDITPITPFDIYAQEESLENLFLNNKISFEEYVNALPPHSAMPKDKLLDILKKREEDKKQIQAMEQYANQQMQQIQNQLAIKQMEEEHTNSSIDEIENQGNQSVQEMLGGMQNVV